MDFFRVKEIKEKSEAKFLLKYPVTKCLKRIQLFRQATADRLGGMVILSYFLFESRETTA